MAMDEKVLPGPSRRFNAVGFCLTAVRCLQWSSSFFVFGSFRLLYDHVQKNKLGEHSRMKAVEILVWNPAFLTPKERSPWRDLLSTCTCFWHASSSTCAFYHRFIYLDTPSLTRGIP